MSAAAASPFPINEHLTQIQILLESSIMLRNILTFLLLLIISISLGGCITIKHEIAPIHATIDINLKIERELDNFFKDLDEQSDTLNYTQSNTEGDK